MYAVSSSLEGKTTYLVSIYNGPLCYRPDFRKRGSKVLWEHIIFVFFYILQFKDECLLSNIWVGDDYLKSVISSAPTNISTLFKESEVQKRTPFMNSVYSVFHNSAMKYPN